MLHNLMPSKFLDMLAMCAQQLLKHTCCILASVTCCCTGTALHHYGKLGSMTAAC